MQVTRRSDPINLTPARRPADTGNVSTPIGDPSRFVLVRHRDVSGVSGVGTVAWGVRFPDGVVALRWKGDWPSSVVFHERGIEAVLAVHGHDGATEIVWLDYTA